MIYNTKRVANKSGEKVEKPKKKETKGEKTDKGEK